MHLRLLFIPEGELIIVAAVKEDGQYYGNFNDNTQNVVALLSNLWQNMVREGRITQVCVNTLEHPLCSPHQSPSQINHAYIGGLQE